MPKYVEDFLPSQEPKRKGFLARTWQGFEGSKPYDVKQLLPCMIGLYFVDKAFDNEEPVLIQHGVKRWKYTLYQAITSTLALGTIVAMGYELRHLS